MAANTKKKSFKELIATSEIPVLVDFYADWCGPCKALAPILKDFAAKKRGKVKVIKIDVDRNQRAAARFKVRGVPTLILFSKGKIVWQQAGVVPGHQLEQLIDRYV